MSVIACSATILCASSPMALTPCSKLPPEWAALPATSIFMKTPPLRPVTTLPEGRPGSELSTARALPRRLLDDRPAGGRADLLVRGDEPDERRRRAAELVVGRKHESVHHEPGLHVADARAIGAPVLDPERAPARLPLREHGVAVAHEHDRLVRSAGRADMGLDGIAEALVRHHRRLDAVLGEKAAEALADRVHARLVIGAGIDVHDLLEKGEHRVALAREPGGDGAGIGRGHRTSGRLGQGARSSA